MSSDHAGVPCQQAITAAVNTTRLLVRKVGICDAVLGISATRGILSPLDVDIQRWAQCTGMRPPAEDALSIVETQEALAAALAEVMRSGRVCLGNQIFNFDFGRGVITVRKAAIRDFLFERRIFLSELHSR
jgi:hypothetical protein